MFNKKSQHMINIGRMIFGILFLYLLIIIIIYLKSNHIAFYRVTSGAISKNETYTALAMRSEQVVNATTEGYVNYFLNDNSKIAKNGTVCKISNTKNVLQNKTLNSSDLADLHCIASRYSQSFDGNDFNSVYDFKYSLDEVMLNISDSTKISGMICTADYDGIIAYSCDGYEYLTPEQLTEEHFRTKFYKKQHLRMNEQISEGDPIYRLIKSETWSIVIPVTDKQTASLASNEKIQVKFLKDGKSEIGQLDLFVVGNQRYVRITFTSGMIRYCNERFLDVELVKKTKYGLKIPIFSIVTKEFYTVPISLKTFSEKDGKVGFLQEIRDKDGKISTSFIETTLYVEDVRDGNTEIVSYVDKNTFHDGDVLIQPHSNTRFTIGATATLNGVYCINKGYAVFRKISIIDQNKEYCIIESGTPWGISQYDYIVFYGSNIKEKDILY